MKPPVIPPSRSNDARVRRVRRAALWPLVLGGVLLVALWLALSAYVRASIEMQPGPSRQAPALSASMPVAPSPARPHAAPEASDAAVPLETGTAAGLIAGLDDGGADASRASISKAVEALADSPSSAALQAEVDRALAVDPVEFRYLKFQLRNKSRRLLQGLGKRLAGEAGQFSVEVRVHANSWGSAQRNLEVSARRAAVVREVLLAAGLPQERVRAEGVGGGEPRRGRNDEETRRLNRRTEIRIVRN